MDRQRGGPSLQFYQSADIISNDPNNRLIQLVVKGNIIQSVMPKPERLTMNGLSSGEGVTVKGKVFSYKQTEEPLEILEVEFLEEAPEGIFEISFKPLSEEQVKQELKAYSGQEMTVKLNPGLSPGTFEFPKAINNQFARCSQSGYLFERLCGSRYFNFR